MAKLQSKLDGLWERQHIEKENVKLLSKFESDLISREQLSSL